MKKFFAILMTAIALFIFGSFGVRAQSVPPAGNVEKGKNLFLKNGCYGCHGTVAQGGTGPRLAPRPMARAAFIAYVRKPGGMPPYSAKVMSDAELADVYAYLETIAAPPPVSSIPLLSNF